MIKLIHHVVMALLTSGSHGRKSSNRDRDVQKRHKLRSLLTRLALANARTKFEDDNPNSRAVRSIIHDASLDKIQQANLKTLIFLDRRNHLLDPPQSKLDPNFKDLVNLNLDINVFMFFKSDHIFA